MQGMANGTQRPLWRLQKRHGRLVAVLLATVLSNAASALDAVGLVLGKGLNDQLIQSKNIASTEIVGLDLRWQTDWQQTFAWANVDELHINLQLAHWQGRHLGESEQMNLLALSALWRWQHADNWFADAGVGVTRLSKDVYEEVTLAGRNQFALDFAVGKQLAERWELSLRYRHYSNGYTARPNPGLDGAVLLLSHRF